MRVDVFLRGKDRRIIVDTKYYASALQTYHGSQTFHSGNLYQIFSYVKNAAGTDPAFQGTEGILLYPEVKHSLDATFSIQGHRIRIATLDLCQPWPSIADRLLEFLFDVRIRI